MRNPGVGWNNTNKNPKGVGLIRAWIVLSFPHVTFVDFNSVASTNLAKLVLKGHLFVVFLLVRYVSFDLFDVGLTNGKDFISTLPLD